MNIIPHVVIGDMDSIGETPPPESCIIYPQEKDDTDMMLAVKYGLDKGYKDFQIYGGLGGRLDHTLANIQLLTYLSTNKSTIGAHGTLWGFDYKVTAITDEEIQISGQSSKKISIFSFDDTSHGVSLKNLKYELIDAELKSAYPIGVSNEFTEKPAYISVRKGTLIILW
jgi:thiamine pyrophosphokinase